MTRPGDWSLTSGVTVGTVLSARLYHGRVEAVLEVGRNRFSADITPGSPRDGDLFSHEALETFAREVVGKPVTVPMAGLLAAPTAEHTAGTCGLTGYGRCRRPLGHSGAVLVAGRSCIFCGYRWETREDLERPGRTAIAAAMGGKLLACARCWSKRHKRRAAYFETRAEAILP